METEAAVVLSVVILLVATLIFTALIALIPAKIASDKGRSFGLWWIHDLDCSISCIFNY